MKLRQIVYRSIASRQLTSQFHELLRTSRIQNRQRQITGAVDFDGIRLVQVIEGPADAVDALFEKIREDSRHGQVRLILDRPIEERQFGQWSMTAIQRPPGDANRSILSLCNAAPSTVLSTLVFYAHSQCAEPTATHWAAPADLKVA